MSRIRFSIEWLMLRVWNWRKWWRQGGEMWVKRMRPENSVVTESLFIVSESHFSVFASSSHLFFCSMLKFPTPFFSLFIFLLLFLFVEVTHLLLLKLSNFISLPCSIFYNLGPANKSKTKQRKYTKGHIWTFQF